MTILTSISATTKKLQKHINKEPNEDNFMDVQPTPTLLSFHCDQCSCIGACGKGAKQHTRMSHRISQVDGNYSEPDDDFPPEMVRRVDVLDLLFRTPPRSNSQSRKLSFDKNL